MGIPSYRTEGGNGGNRGHSNMDHWMKTEEIKDITRKRRRLEANTDISGRLDPTPASMLTHLPITPELITLCRALAADVAANDLVYSDDEYQHPHFCGGWSPDGHKGPGFYFSYYAPDGNDYIFHLTNDQPAQIAAGATPKIGLEYWKKSPIGPYDPA